MSEAALSDAVLSDAMLPDAVWSDAALSGAVLSGAALSGAALSGAALSEAPLCGASSFMDTAIVQISCPWSHISSNATCHSSEPRSGVMCSVGAAYSFSR